MPIPADPNARVTLLVRVSEETSQCLKTMAAEQNRSVAAVVRDLLRAQLQIEEQDRLGGQLSLDGLSRTAQPAEGSSAA
jgi:plasmid stability protein